MFSHTLTDSLKNIYNGATQYYSINKKTVIASEPQQNATKSFDNSLFQKVNLSDLSLLGLYRNNLEPQAIKDIQKFIGINETYWYMIRNGFAAVLMNLIEYGSTALSTIAGSSATKIIQGDTSLNSIIYFSLDSYFFSPIKDIVNFFIAETIHGEKNNIKIKHLIKDNLYQDKFLPLFLKENSDNEYRQLENNIFSVLQYYSSNVANVLTAAVVIPTIIVKYRAVSKVNPNINLSLAASFFFSSGSKMFQYFTKNIVTETNEKNSYRMSLSENNIRQDTYQLKETLFVVGHDHLCDRDKLHDKLFLKLKQETIPLLALIKLFNFEALNQITTLVLASQNIEKIKTSLIERNKAEQNINNQLIDLAGEFILINKLVDSQLQVIYSSFIADSDFDLQVKHINKIVKMIDNYYENNSKNQKIYQNSSSSKLIISDLKVDIIAKNQTIVDFSSFNLEIDIVPGIHYLFEGQNSVGKSLLLKLVIGYSGGLAVNGKIAYPQGFSPSDITYVLQDDYYGIFKPLLHRLAVPKLLPADVNIGSIVASNILGREDFNQFVDFMSELLFEMKYEPTCQNIFEVKKLLLENYENYQIAFETGDQKELDKLVKSYINQSGGQKKKLAIANAIYNKAKLLLLDESFNAIDQETKIIIYKLLEKHLAHATVIAIQHQVANHLIEEKAIQEKDEQVSTLLKQLAIIAKTEDTEAMKNILDLIEKIPSEDSATLGSEESKFFHQIITMNRLQGEDGQVKTSFEITSLLKEDENLVRFYPFMLSVNGTEINDDVCVVVGQTDSN